jgi:tetratricopeptide (TPR) repeat protein
MGRYAEAEPLLLAAHQAATRPEGPSRDSLETAASLAKFYTDVADYTEAEPYCRDVLEQRIDIWGRDHIYTARAMTLLAQILNRQKRYAEAEPWARQAVEVRDKRLPPRNWERAKSRSILGATLTGLGKFEEAEPLLLQSLPIIEDDRGPQHRHTYEALERIIDFYNARGDTETAQQYRRKLPGCSWWCNNDSR